MLTVSQKTLFGILCSLLLLMVFFSFEARNHLGQSGFDSCVQKKCVARGQPYCEKNNEINNCCLGAGGRTEYVDRKVICVFI